MEELMRLDNIPKYRTLWYEDEHGNEIDFDFKHGFPDFKNITGDVYQHSDSAVVSHSINLCNNMQDDKWPVRFLKWLMNKMPSSWHARKSHVLRGETTINCVYPIVKYLVEERDWSFPEACVAGSNLCERCLNIALWELEGTDLDTEEYYLNTTNTHCMYCKHIDYDHHAKYVPKAMYRAFARGDNLQMEYNLILKDRMHEQV